MRCARARILISARRDDALHGNRLDSCAAHLAACPACRAFERELASVSDRLDQWTAADAPPGFADRVMAAMERGAARQSAWREALVWLRPAPIGLAAAAFVLGVLLSSSMDGTATAPAERVDTVASTGDEAFDPLPTDSAAARLLVLLGHREE